MAHIFDTTLRRVTLYSLLLMGLTSIHHVYGAFIYHTPWRLHVLFLSLPVMALTLGLDYLLRRSGNGKLIFGLYWSVTLLISILMIGTFEGLYNHLLKNVLFFMGMSASKMRVLYPPGAYEMPDDLFFEMTGVMQGIVVIPLALYFIRLIPNRSTRHLLKQHHEG